eukprot:XP_019927459.1 PREDICTED: uncharacterized protein LOC109620152 isoform X3 [Crassostrea gigas]
MDHFKLVRDIWPLLREHLVDPLEILPDIQGFTDVDREDIKAAALRSKIQAIDKLQEALRRRNFRCFKSFLYALLKHKYVDLAMEIAERGGIQLEYPPRSTGAMQQNITSPITGIRNVQVYRGTAQICARPWSHSSSSSSSDTRSIPSNTRSAEQQASGGTDEDQLTSETELGEVSVEITDRWAAELSKNKLWRELSKKMGFKKNKVMEIEKSGNAGDAFLDELTLRGFKVADLMKHLQDEKFSSFLQIIRLDLGESSLNNFNIGASPVESDARFENVILGLPPSRDSSSNLEEKIQNNLIDSPAQSSRNLSESRSSSSSSFNKNLKPENNTDSNKHGMEAVTLTGHNVSFGSGKKSGQEEDQQPQMIPTLTSRSNEGTEGSDISPIIRDTQIEIALVNKKKELDSPYDEIYQRETSEQLSSLGADSAHQTCPKSTFLDEHLNSLGNLSMKPKESTSKRFTGLLSEENMRTSTEAVSQTDSLRSREPLVHQAQDDTASQKGSSLIQGIHDITNNLEQVGFEKDPHAARPSGSSINIPVQPVPTATEVGNPIAAPESSTNQTSQFDLFQSECGQQSEANLMGSQQMQGPYTSPVPVSDESEAKNLEMEATALREDMANQSNTVGYRDIQNSIPDQNQRCLENMEYHSSIVNQFCYSEGGRSQSQGRSNSSNVQTNARETSGRREGSTLGSMSNVLNDYPQLNDSLLNEETLTSNNSS